MGRQEAGEAGGGVRLSAEVPAGRTRCIGKVALKVTLLNGIDLGVTFVLMEYIPKG